MDIPAPHFIKMVSVKELPDEEFHQMMEQIRKRRLIVLKASARRENIVDADTITASTKKRMLKDFGMLQKELDKLEALYEKMMGRWQTIMAHRMSLGDDIMEEIQEMRDVAADIKTDDDGAIADS